MKKRGFTLIELLAVIIVLGVLLSIAIPRIMGAIDASKKHSLIISAESLIKELNKTYITINEKYFTGKNYTISNNSFSGDKLDVSGELPDSGNLYINSDGKVALSITKGDYCVVKDFNDDKLLASSNFATCILDIPQPVPENCFFTSNNGIEVTITGYKDECPKDVLMPTTIGGLPIKILGSYAFESKQLTSVTIPSGVTIIKIRAFVDNQLTNVTIPSGVKTIEYGAFERNQLTSVIIPNSVTTIGASAFLYNEITNVAIPNSVTSIGWTAFAYNQITSITIPNNITVIEGGSFSNNQLTSVIIPNSVTSIQYGAFKNNKISSLFIPNNVTMIAETTFNNNQLSDDQAFIYARNPDGSKDFTYLVSYGGANRNSVTIPNGVIKLGSFLFSWMGVKSITVPNSVTIIGDYAFHSNQLTTINIPNGVTEMREHVLSYNQLTNIIIPDSVTSIGYAAFAENQLTNITLPNGLISIGDYAFHSNQLTSLTIPSNVTSIGEYAFSPFGWEFTNNIVSITIPANIPIISESISSSFYTAYVTINSSSAGTYTAPSQNGVWTKQP